jgi:DNA-binding protein H-NS
MEQMSKFAKMQEMQTQAATQRQAAVKELATRFDQLTARMAVYETLQAVTSAALTIAPDEAVIKPQITTTNEKGERESGRQRPKTAMRANASCLLRRKIKKRNGR